MFKKKLLRLITVIVGVLAFVVVLQFAITPKAYAAPASCNSNLTSWGISVNLWVKLVDDLNGGQVSYAQNYRFNTTVDNNGHPEYGNNPNPPGIVRFPASIFESRTASQDFTANGNNTIQCFGAKTYKFDSLDSSDGYALDCYYNPGNFPGFWGAGFTFRGVGVDDPGWQYGYFENTVRFAPAFNGDDINNHQYLVELVYHKTAPPPATLSTQKYQDGHGYGVDGNIPAPINNAKVTLQNQHGPWGGSSGTSNPFPPSGSGPNVWVNQDSPNSLTPTPYSTTVEVPPGYRVKRWEIASVGGYYDARSVHNESTNVVGGIYVKPGSTTWVDFFFEQITRSNLDGINCSASGTVTGWVQIPNGSGGVKGGDVHLYIDKTPGVGVSPNVIIPAQDLIHRTENGVELFRFNYNLPQQFYDGKAHSVHAYSFDQNGTPFELSSSPQSFRCPGSTGDINQDCQLTNGVNSLVGWGFDGQEEAKSPTFHIYVDGKFAAAITADKDRPDVLTYVKNQHYPGPFEPTGKYGFEIPDLSKVLPGSLFDGNNHTMNVYLITKDGTNPSLAKGGASNTFICKFREQLYPWLQTYNGDVIANGQVVGQKAGDKGARAANNPDKESEYLIISAVGGSGPFCSTTNYILTNGQATNGNCQNGSGYRINSQGLGGAGADKIIAAINKAWVANGSGNSGGGGNTKCNPYNTEVRSNLEGASSTSPVRLATGYGSLSCINGTVIKLNGNKLGNIVVDSGRITIWVTADQLAASGGTLTIDNNIVYNYSPGYDDARKVPNLAIIVDGNVNIDSNNILSGAGVSQLDAAIYATGKINTCSQFSSVVITSPQNCNKGLIVHGMLAGKNGFGFNRTYDNNGTNPPPAEQVILTGQTVAFPPPGLDNLYFGDFDSASQIDTGELQPRF